MDLSPVKLVVTDMDGTLLNSKSQVSTHFFELYEQLKKHNIHFVAASGRQYHSIVDKLAPIKDEITIIAENGGLTKQGDQELLLTSLPSHFIQKLVPYLRNINGAFSVLCGKESAYIETANMQFIEMFKEYYAAYTSVENLSEVSKDDFLKIAVYHFESSEKYLYPHVQHMEHELQVKVSGEHWLDLSHPNANKGYALQRVQQMLGISKQETLVFGDYNNDLEMLACADYSVAMDNAHPNVKKAANFSTKSNDAMGVEYILEKLIQSKT